jgi:hypothetical protein
MCPWYPRGQTPRWLTSRADMSVIERYGFLFWWCSRLLAVYLAYRWVLLDA